MNNVIAQKDRLLLSRESLMKALAVVTIVLLVAALFAGLQREQVFDKEKSAAEATDKAVWMGQGDRNPHSAAHFSRYAFRPAAPLALIDPGTSDFAGLAVWMEAHYQDPAVFRRAEDGGELSRYSQLTPAFLVLVAAPLLVFLMMYGSVSGEREDGTLRQLLAAGAGVRQFFLGKYLSGLRLTLTVFTVVFAALSLIAIVTTPAEITGDTLVRAGALFTVFAIYLAICVAIALGASALFRTRQSSFLALAGLWAVLTVLAPRIATDVSTSVYPQPDARQVSSELSAASNIYYADKQKQEEIEAQVLQEYGVSKVEDLPINYGAYLLQYSEEMSEPEFDRLYGELQQHYAAQEGVARWFSLLTPTIVAANLSKGVAGTDREHQWMFTVAAEAHRREMIELLNVDYMLNSGDKGAAYTADDALWGQFEDFDHGQPSLGSVAGAYVVDVLLLIAWFAATFFGASLLVGRAVRQEVPTA